MESKFFYKGQDLTLDFYEKIRVVVELLAENEQKSFDECYELFVKSKTYEALQEPESLLWSESPQFICDEYYRENRF